jgi:uncharacterized membrane protein HdeD (DUF308 family)
MKNFPQRLSKVRSLLKFPRKHMRVLKWIITSGAYIPFASVNAQGLQQGINNAGTVATSGGLRFFYVTTALGRVILFLLSLVAVLGLITLVTGGIMYIISFGDENRTQRAKRIILYGVIGIILAITSFVIVALIGTIFT